jgi:hypothetical protein
MLNRSKTKFKEYFLSIRTHIECPSEQVLVPTGPKFY